VFPLSESGTLSQALDIPLVVKHCISISVVPV